MMKRLKNQSNRAGIALVIVLGFVAVLAVLAVSLMISMRIERLATNSYAETTRARQLLNVALSRALDDIDEEMLSSSSLYPPSLMYYNQGAGRIVESNLLKGIAARYAPANYTSSLPSSIFLRDVTVGTTVVGRVGYLAMDSSGLVDINLGSLTNRHRGFGGGREIQISPSILTEIKTLSDFLDYRSNTWSRVDTLAELYYAGVKASVIASNNPPRSIFTYSRYGFDYDPEGKEKVYLGGDADELESRRDEITEALQKSGVANPQEVFDNLLDYVDTDSDPRSLESFNTEAVPMINEVIFSNSLQNAVREIESEMKTVSTYNVYMTIETWFPFADRTNTGSQISMDSGAVKFSPAGAAGALLQKLIPDPDTSLLPPGVYQRTIPTNHVPNSFALTTFQWQRIATNVPLNNGRMAVRVNLDGDLFVLDNRGSKVDKARPIGTANLIAGAGQDQRSSFQVSDPRLNHRTDAWLPLEFSATAGTPGQMNNPQKLKDMGEGPSTMYVRDFPLDQFKLGVGLGTVGELGFLSVGQPWRTIALYNTPGQPLHPVLDYFTLDTTNQVRRGLVNINSTNRAALASVFYANWLDVAPEAGGPTVTVNAAFSLADNLIQQMGPDQTREKNRKLSLLGQFDQGLINGINGELTTLALSNDATREAIIRNSANLFSYRQNLFTIFLYGQSITPGGATGVEQRAVAIVWRDPEFDDPANQTNKTLLRFYKNL